MKELRHNIMIQVVETCIAEASGFFGDNADEYAERTIRIEPGVYLFHEAEIDSRHKLFEGSSDSIAPGWWIALPLEDVEFPEP